MTKIMTATFAQTNQLAQLVDKKLQCLLQLHDLGQRQIRLIHESNMAHLLKVLTAKGHLIEALRMIDRQLDPFRQQDPESRSWRSQQDRARCAEQAAQCQMLLTEIMNQEKQSEHHLKRLRNDVAQQLQTANTAGAARSAYVAEQTIPTSIFDASSEG